MASSSSFVGVCWDKKSSKWQASIGVGGKKRRLGHFVDERMAAARCDAERVAMGKAAKNSTTPDDERMAAARCDAERVAMGKAAKNSTSAEEQAAAVAMAEAACRQPPSSSFVGVSWDKAHRKWKASIGVGGKLRHLGLFDDERMAAARCDAEWVAMGKAAKNSTSAEEQAAAVAMTEAARSQPPSSSFVGVSWDEARHKWVARISVGGKMRFLGYFDDERMAAARCDAEWVAMGKAAKNSTSAEEQAAAVAMVEAARTKPPSSSFVGVGWNKAASKWVARISVGGKARTIGFFRHELQAAVAYDA
eukprot:CAMPEP_0203833210 /NCGR_PEP_ID=MMETSP0115-20131106/72541_1 /ASSEMBLY_ACC=CAM_ASM_000227 /TAXON_ID=33651 /ORGANISM="Bicosoecid sp, Strain ms1" /LENGTH=305 /DNA_ID=CAMNT_0050742281 /DNA_START=124 /DNA_END=1039 /DNA_ORIENTATION=-